MWVHDSRSLYNECVRFRFQTGGELIPKNDKGQLILDEESDFTETWKVNTEQLLKFSKVQSWISRGFQLIKPGLIQYRILTDGSCPQYKTVLNHY